MNQAIRVIPCLDVSGGRVVKGVHFTDLRDAGDPVELATNYSSQGADELVFLDITATVEGRGTTLEMVRRTAGAVTIPFAVGGGVRELADAKALLDAGADKVGVNTAAINRPELIDEIAGAVGTAGLVLALDARREEGMPSGYGVVTHGGRKSAGLDAVTWARQVAERGAGEILLTSMDGDGTTDGYDLELIAAVASAVDIPVVASGGAGELRHFVDAARAGATAVLAASVFHFRTLTVQQVKDALAAAGFGVR